MNANIPREFCTCDCVLLLLCFPLLFPFTPLPCSLTGYFREIPDTHISVRCQCPDLDLTVVGSSPSFSVILPCCIVLGWFSFSLPSLSSLEFAAYWPTSAAQAEQCPSSCGLMPAVFCRPLSTFSPSSVSLELSLAFSSHFCQLHEMFRFFSGFPFSRRPVFPFDDLLLRFPFSR